MRKEIDIFKLTLGLKIHQLRQDKDLSYQQLSELTGLAVSYLHNIEKGKKYPKADKILVLAKALDTDYNYLVSLDGDRRLQPILDLINSDFLKIFPLEMFGINLPKLMELLSAAPDRANAFISTVVKIVRNYQLQGEDFYKSALRSYQDAHNNYFNELEEAVRSFKEKHQLPQEGGVQPEKLVRLLGEYSISLNKAYLPQQENLHGLRSFFNPTKKILYINTSLTDAQECFLLAKELGFQYLKLQERPLETRMTEVDSFDKLLNNFKASYFAVALLIDEREFVEDINTMSKWEEWQGDAFLALLEKYDVTAEMLIQRMANILPKHFGIKDLFFFRFFAKPDLQKFEMTKEMHLSQLHDPHANQLDEHYCRRWVSISLIRRLKAMQSIENHEGSIIAAQISKYWNTPNAYFCISMAKASRNDVENSSSITIGLLVNDKLRQLFPFLEHPKFPVKEVHTTCERCGISDCGERAYPPTVLQHNRRKDKIKESLEELKK